MRRLADEIVNRTVTPLPVRLLVDVTNIRSSARALFSLCKS